jgi:DNA invertase Pin-like site-specific DNA recombinase
VSSKTQDYQAQVEALKAADCERIFSEKASGKSTDGRPEFGKLLKALLPGDTVVVTKLDRLARSSRDLYNILHELESLSCGFVSLWESWCDTTTDVGKLMLTIMGGISQFERSLIRKRTEEGIERAKRLGKKFGRLTGWMRGRNARSQSFMLPAKQCLSWPKNTALASAPFGGRFNPKPKKRHKRAKTPNAKITELILEQHWPFRGKRK